MNATTVLWIYIVLLVVGGLIGFLKAKSQVSLIMSVVFAALLALCAAGLSRAGVRVPVLGQSQRGPFCR